MTDTVFIGGWRTGAEVYHTDSECPRLPETQNTMSREDAEDWGRRECKYCAGTFAFPDGHGRRDRPSLRDLVEAGQIDEEHTTVRY